MLFSVHNLPLTWTCFFQPSCPPDDLMWLACFWNNMHDEAAVHCDDWETFFHVWYYLMQCCFWSMWANGTHQINWTLFLNWALHLWPWRLVQDSGSHWKTLRRASRAIADHSSRPLCHLDWYTWQCPCVVNWAHPQWQGSLLHVQGWEWKAQDHQSWYAHDCFVDP